MNLKMYDNWCRLQGDQGLRGPPGPPGPGPREVEGPPTTEQFPGPPVNS